MPPHDIASTSREWPWKSGAPSVGRRAFLTRAAAASAAALGGGLGPAAAPALAAIESSSAKLRRGDAYQRRVAAAQVAFQRPLPLQASNGDEERYADRAGSYSKGLSHDALGNVDPWAYDALRQACASGSAKHFEQIPMGGSRKLVSPRAGLTFDLEGADPCSVAIPPPPALASAEAAGELAELYWMAAARDVPFTEYAFDATIAAAATDLSRLTAFRGPRLGGAITPQTLFRGSTPGDIAGPYVSQFLWMDIPMGALHIPQTVETVVPGIDYLTTHADWLGVQNGDLPAVGVSLDPTRRYMRSLRDLAHWVHIDALYQAYHQACLILLGLAPTDPGLPYRDSYTQEGFATFGGPHILTLVTEVATRALKAVWFQKWFVHRRLRPEAMGGLVHQTVTGLANRPLHPDVLNSGGPARIAQRYGSHLLPQVFPEGSPLHPSYGAGHATVAGACVTILKAWFDESFVIPRPVVADASGLTLVPYTGPPLTVGNELNKLAANVAIGRNAAGVHYRSDYWESVRLGELVALTLLEEQREMYDENFTLNLTLFDGRRVAV